MKPIKAFVPLAKWLLRLAALTIVYSSFLDTVLLFTFKGLPYFIVLSIVVLTVLLFIGGFFKNAVLTILSGFFLFAACIVHLVMVSGFSVDNLIAIFPLTVIGFYFLARGNVG
jgi:hypothetical protein